LNHWAGGAGATLLQVRNIDGLDGTFLADFDAILVATDSPIALQAGKYETRHAIAQGNPRAARLVLYRITKGSHWSKGNYRIPGRIGAPIPAHHRRAP
jgi:hypothetical protein